MTKVAIIIEFYNLTLLASFKFIIPLWLIQKFMLNFTLIMNYRAEETKKSATDSPEKEVRLSVLVCTFGDEGIRRVAEADYPVVDGVEYCISWQLPEGEAVTPEALRRPDIKVSVSRTRGLSRNRNLSLEMASGELALISDDDVRYTPEYFDNLFKAFGQYPEADLITFKYESKDYPKSFSDFSFDLRHSPKGYFTTSFEIAFRTKSVAGRLKFDENFGIGARWPSGEEDIFVHDAKRHGLCLRFVPLPVARHDGTTTSDREAAKGRYVETKGAVFRILFPFTWPLRMLTHLPRRHRDMSAGTFVKSWIRGALTSKRAK